MERIAKIAIVVSLGLLAIAILLHLIGSEGLAEIAADVTFFGLVISSTILFLQTGKNNELKNSSDSCPDV